MSQEIFLHLRPDYDDDLSNKPELCAEISFFPNFSLTTCYTFTFANYISAMKFKLTLIAIAEFRTNSTPSLRKNGRLKSDFLSLAHKLYPELFFSPETENLIHERRPHPNPIPYLMRQWRNGNSPIQPKGLPSGIISFPQNF